MKEEIITIDLKPLVDGEIITQLYDIADYMERNNKVLDADGLRTITFSFMGGLFR